MKLILCLYFLNKAGNSESAHAASTVAALLSQEYWTKQPQKVTPSTLQNIATRLYFYGMTLIISRIFGKFSSLEDYQSKKLQNHLKITFLDHNP